MLARKLSAGVMGVVMVVMLAASSGASAATATESTQWQVDAEHSGSVYGAGVVPPLHEAWSDDLGFGSTTVAIDDGLVFTIVKPDDGPDLYLEAIQLSTGAPYWRQQFTSYDATEPYIALDGGKLFVVAPEAGSSAVQVSAFTEQTGLPLWSVSEPGQYVVTPPVTQDGVLYFNAYGVGGTVYALRESDGSTLWSASDEDEGGVTLAGQTVVVSGACDYTYGFSATTGAQLWLANPDGCDGGGSYTASFDGTHIWAEGQRGYSAGYIFSPSNGASSGQFTGYSPVFGYGEAVIAQPASVEDGGGSSDIEALNQPSLATRWSFTIPDANPTLPLLADGYAFVADNTGDLWALNACTGASAWQGQVQPPFEGDEPLASLAAGDGYLVVPTADGLEALKGSGMPANTAPNCLAKTSPTLPPPGGKGGTKPPGAGTSELRVVTAACSTASDRCRLTLRVGQAGTLALRLVRGQRTRASGRVHVSKGRVKTSLRLSPRLRSGRYSLVLSLTVDKRVIVRRTVRVRVPETSKHSRHR